jgi:hypothetical protein
MKPCSIFGASDGLYARTARGFVNLTAPDRLPQVGGGGLAVGVRRPDFIDAVGAVDMTRIRCAGAGVKTSRPIGVQGFAAGPPRQTAQAATRSGGRWE